MVLGRLEDLLESRALELTMAAYLTLVAGLFPDEFLARSATRAGRTRSLPGSRLRKRLMELRAEAHLPLTLPGDATWEEARNERLGRRRHDRFVRQDHDGLHPCPLLSTDTMTPYTWRVLVPTQFPLILKANTKSEARGAAKKILGLERLPVGTRIERSGQHAEQSGGSAQESADSRA